MRLAKNPHPSRIFASRFDNRRRLVEKLDLGYFDGLDRRTSGFGFQLNRQPNSRGSSNSTTWEPPTSLAILRNSTAACYATGGLLAFDVIQPGSLRQIDALRCPQGAFGARHQRALAISEPPLGIAALRTIRSRSSRSWLATSAGAGRPNRIRPTRQAHETG
jgi:hypothetical protein